MKFKVGDKVRATWSGEEGEVKGIIEHYEVFFPNKHPGVTMFYDYDSEVCFPDELELLCSQCGQNPVPDDETGERLGLCPPCANEEETLKGHFPGGLAPT